MLGEKDADAVLAARKGISLPGRSAADEMVTSDLVVLARKIQRDPVHWEIDKFDSHHGVVC